MLIILEGPDGSGKSSLAARIVTALSVKYPDDSVELLHRGPPSAHPLDEYVTPLLDYRPGAGRHIVCDRWHLGEIVYPAILERKTVYTLPLRRYVESFLQARGALTHVMETDADTCVSRVRERGDDLVGVNQVRAAHDMFVNAALASPTAEVLSHETPDCIIANARRLEGGAYHLNSFITPIGAPTPMTALVFGDERACGGGAWCDHKRNHSELGTAFMPYPATSGHYLLGAWHSARALYANACDVDDPVALWKAVGEPPRVLALGYRAHVKLDEAGITHGTVPHPQFVRRFHHRAQAEYGSLIQRTILTGGNQIQWRPSSPAVPAETSTETSSSTS